MTKEELQELRHLYFDEKQSLEMIAEHFDRDIASIWNRVKQMGKCRNRSESQLVANNKGRGQGVKNRHLRNGLWEGGRNKTSYGYIEIWVSIDDPFFCMVKPSRRTKSSGYIMEHRLVMARHLERPLCDSEKVHHLNGIKDDNRIKNLAIVPHHSPHLFPQLLQKRIRLLEAQLSQQRF